MLLWGGVGGGGVGSSHPVPSLPLRRKILAQGVSLLVLVCFWPLAFAGPHIPVCPGHSCMLFGGMLALAGAAVVDHARCARRRSKGSGPGLVPLRACPYAVGGVPHPIPRWHRKSFTQYPYGTRSPSRVKIGMWTRCSPPIPF